MNEEKILILKMIENGTIKAEEGAKLLAAIEDKKETNNNYGQQNNNNNNNHNSNEKQNDQINLAKIGEKLDKEFKILEPKFKSAAAEVFNRTSEFTGKIVKSFDNQTTHVNGKYLMQTNYNEVVTDKQNIIDFKVKNGYITIKGINSNNITVNIKFKGKNSDARVILKNVANKYYLEYNPVEIEGMNVECFIPYDSFSNINLITENGNVDISSFNASENIIRSLNGNVSIIEVNGKIDIDATNGDHKIENCVSEFIALDNTNGNIYINADAKVMKISNSNGKVNFDVSNINKFREYNFDVSTNNDSITAKLPSGLYVGKKIKASTINASVNVDNTGLMYVVNEHCYKELISLDYDLKDIKINTDFSTTNDNININ